MNAINSINLPYKNVVSNPHQSGVLVKGSMSTFDIPQFLGLKPLSSANREKARQLTEQYFQSLGETSPLDENTYFENNDEPNVMTVKWFNNTLKPIVHELRDRFVLEPDKKHYTVEYITIRDDETRDEAFNKILGYHQSVDKWINKLSFLKKFIPTTLTQLNDTSYIAEDIYMTPVYQKKYKNIKMNHLLTRVPGFDPVSGKPLEVFLSIVSMEKK